jgi:hypothetical protein
MPWNSGRHDCDPKKLSTTWKLGHHLRADERRWPTNEERSKFMPLIQLLEVLIVVGVLLWLVNRFIPMQATIKSILNGVVVIAVVLWLLNVFGLFHSLSNVRIGRG